MTATTLDPSAIAAAVPRLSARTDAAALDIQLRHVLAAIETAVEAAPSELDIAAEGAADLAALVHAYRVCNWTGINALAQKYTCLDVMRGPLTRCSDEEERVLFRESIQAGIHANFASFVRIEIPDGGVYRILNGRPQLEAFRRVILSKFKRTQAPVLRTAQTYSRGFAPLARNVTVNAIAKAAGYFTAAAEVDSRLSQPVQDEGFTIATNREALIALVGGSAIPIAEIKNFPRHWRNALPAGFTMRARSFSVSAEVCQVTVAGDWLAAESNRVRAVFSTDESAVIDLEGVGDRLVLSAQTSTDDCSYGETTYGPAARRVRVRWSHVDNAIRASRMLGVRNVSFCFCPNLVSRRDGAALVLGDRGFVVFAPMTRS